MSTAPAGNLAASLWALLGLHGLGWADLLGLWGHYLLLSVLAVGGAITTAPEMQRLLVTQRGWLDETQFTSSIAIAQAAPGPNILFVALLGWNVAGAMGVLATMSGILLPSSLLALYTGRFGRRRADALWMRAFTAGMTPITLGLLLATGWLLAAPTAGVRSPRQDGQLGGLLDVLPDVLPDVLTDGLPGGLVLLVGTVLLMQRTKVNPVWLIGLGAVAGMAGLV